MAKYTTDEFLGKSEPTTLKKEVEKKIHLLYEFCVLQRNSRARDSREKALRKILLSCKNEIMMSNIVTDLTRGKCTLDALLRRYNYAHC